jgi:hypothetical protein
VYLPATLTLGDISIVVSVWVCVYGISYDAVFSFRTAKIMDKIMSEQAQPTEKDVVFPGRGINIV